METSPSFFERICCCQSKLDKEPPVTEIAVNHLPQTVHQNVETPASVDSEHIDLELRQPSCSVPAPLENREGFNANDLVMDDVCGVEDNISINDNVIEEVDEEELKRIHEEMRKEQSSQPIVVNDPVKKVEDSALPTILETVHEDTSPSTREPSEAESKIEETSETSSQPTPDWTPETSPRSDEEALVPKRSSTPDEEHFASAAEILPKIDLALTQSNENEPKKDEEPMSSARRVAEILSESSDTDDEDELMVDVVEPPIIPAKPQMYANSSDDESDEDDDKPREILPPPVRATPALASDVISSDGEISPHGSDKENGGVTRLSLKADGRASVITGGDVRIILEPSDSLTDDEFSEKLI